jgi:hypothetical protein
MLSCLTPVACAKCVDRQVIPSAAPGCDAGPWFVWCSGIAQCSGALIGVQRQHVLTAGHCLVDSSTSQVTCFGIPIEGTCGPQPADAVAGCACVRGRHCRTHSLLRHHRLLLPLRDNFICAGASHGCVLGCATATASVPEHVLLCRCRTTWTRSRSTPASAAATCPLAR